MSSATTSTVIVFSPTTKPTSVFSSITVPFNLTVLVAFGSLNVALTFVLSVAYGTVAEYSVSPLANSNSTFSTVNPLKFAFAPCLVIIIV